MVKCLFGMVYNGMFKYADFELILAFIPNKLTQHLLMELAGLSEGLLESYGDSWGFADECGLHHFNIKFS
jgi:hypothetical protein